MEEITTTELVTVTLDMFSAAPATFVYADTNGMLHTDTNNDNASFINASQAFPNGTDDLTTRRMFYPGRPSLGVEDFITIPLYSLIFILSVIGNLLVIITLIQNKRMRTVTNVFLLNLSVSDLLLAVFCMPFTIIPIKMRTFPFGPVMCVMIRYLQGVSVSVSCFTLVAISLERYFAICRPLHSRKWQTLSHSYKTIAVCWLLGLTVGVPITTKYRETRFGVSVSVSCFTLVAISLERYFAICRPLHSRKWQTLSHSYKTIAVCWLLGLTVGVPIAVTTKYRETRFGSGRCREIWPDPGLLKAYTIALDLVLLILPVIIMSVSYGKISYTLWSGMKLDKQEMENQNGHGQIYKGDASRSLTYKDGFGRSVGPSEMVELKAANRKVSTGKLRFDTRGVRQSNSEKSKAAKKRVIKMLFAVVLEFFICWTPLFVLNTWITIDEEHAGKHIPPMLRMIVFLFSYVSSCCNPITYCFMNKNFRNGFVAVFRCCRCGVKRGRERNEMPSFYHYSSARTGVSHMSSYDKVKDESDEL